MFQTVELMYIRLRLCLCWSAAFRSSRRKSLKLPTLKSVDISIPVSLPSFPPLFPFLFISLSPSDTWQKTLHLFVAAVSSRQYSEDIQKCLLYRARQRKRRIEARYLDFWPHPEFPVLHLSSDTFSNLWSKVHHLLACSGNQPLFTVLFWQLKLFCPHVSKQGQLGGLTQQIQNRAWYHLATSSEMLISRHIFSRVQSRQRCRQYLLFPWIEKATEILQMPYNLSFTLLYIELCENFSIFLRIFVQSFSLLTQKTYS